MRDFLNTYFSESISFLGVLLAATIILTTFAINGTLASWVEGLLAPWF